MVDMLNFMGLKIRHFFDNPSEILHTAFSVELNQSLWFSLRSVEKYLSYDLWKVHLDAILMKFAISSIKHQRVQGGSRPLVRYILVTPYFSKSCTGLWFTSRISHFLHLFSLKTHCKVFQNIFVSVETMAQFELSNSELSQRCKRLYGDLLFLTKANYLMEDIRFFHSCCNFVGHGIMGADLSLSPNSHSIRPR